MEASNSTETTALLATAQTQNMDQPGAMPPPAASPSFVSLVVQTGMNMVVKTVMGAMTLVQMTIASFNMARRMFPLFCCVHGCLRCCCCCLCCHCVCIFGYVMQTAKDFAIFSVKWIRYSWVDIVTILTTTTTAGIVSPFVFRFFLCRLSLLGLVSSNAC